MRAIVALVQCRTARGIGIEVKGSIVFGEAWNSFNVRTALIEPTCVRAWCLLSQKAVSTPAVDRTAQRV